MRRSDRGQNLENHDCAAPRDLPDGRQSSASDGATVPEAELRLMSMILEDAIECFIRHAGAESTAGQREFRDAERWLFATGDSWIFSCESICGHLGVDPGFIRTQLRQHRRPSFALRAKHSPTTSSGRQAD